MCSKKKKRVREKDIENLLLKYLNILPNTFAWKNNTTGVYDEKRGVYRSTKNKWAIKGVSDILGIHNGRMLAIEVKTASGRVTKEQAQFIDRVIKLGGIAGVARSVADARAILAEADTQEGIE
jgi:hypothetical protein